MYKIRDRATSPGKIKMIHMSIRMAEDDAEDLRLLAKARDVSMSEVARKAIKREVRRSK